jgi:hypothetical protein
VTRFARFRSPRTGHRAVATAWRRLLHAVLFRADTTSVFALGPFPLPSPMGAEVFLLIPLPANLLIPGAHERLSRGCCTGGKNGAAAQSEMPVRRISSQSFPIASSKGAGSLPSGRKEIGVTTVVLEELAPEVGRASAGMSNIIACHIRKPVLASASAS